jgi:Tfp pilus assembly pilus retraction ATPase PilT
MGTPIHRIRSDTGGMALPTQPPEAASSAPLALRDLLHAAVQQGASDVHIRAGAVPLLRVSGDLWPFDIPPLTAEQAQALVLAGEIPVREAEKAVPRAADLQGALRRAGYRESS